ncbi:MAG: hypothetical protein HOO93_05005 [Methyloglobulus sp.]|nr:hypothetical protein [Methyloglobulus sp.]
MLLPPPPCVGILALASRLCQGSLRYTTFLDKAESPRRTTPTAVGGKSIPTGRVCSGTHPRCGYGRAGSDMKTALWFSNFPRRQSAAFSRKDRGSQACLSGVVWAGFGVLSMI